MKCLRDPELTVWGDGTPTRDFLFVEDVAEALLRGAEGLAGGSYVNAGSGTEISVRDLVGLIAKHTGFSGPIRFDASKAGGDARRCTSVELAARLMAFKPEVDFDEGIRRTVAWYKSNFKPE
jgi:GDP-L-fucose synthase